MNAELTHRQSSTQFHGGIDVGGGRIASLDHSNGLEHVRDEQSIDDESWIVLAIDGSLLHLDAELGEGVPRLVTRLIRLDDLDELHLRYGIETEFDDDVSARRAAAGRQRRTHGIRRSESAARASSSRRWP